MNNNLKVLLNKAKCIITQKKEDNINFYEGIERLIPFTILCGGQFSSFISNLATDKSLSKNIREAFENLWNCACVDIDGYGNNIWNLKKGQFQIYESNDINEIKVQFEKRSSKNLDKYEEGRASFAFKSKKGNIFIHQHDQNKEIFLIYICENISEDLLNAIKRAEAKSLGINIREQQHESILNYSESSTILLESSKGMRAR